MPTSNGALLELALAGPDDEHHGRGLELRERTEPVTAAGRRPATPPREVEQRHFGFRPAERVAHPFHARSADERVPLPRERSGESSAVLLLVGDQEYELFTHPFPRAR